MLKQIKFLSLMASFLNSFIPKLIPHLVRQSSPWNSLSWVLHSLKSFHDKMNHLVDTALRKFETSLILSSWRGLFPFYMWHWRVLKMGKNNDSLAMRNDVALSRPYHSGPQLTGTQDLYLHLSLRPALFHPSAWWCFYLAKYNWGHQETLEKVT